MTRSPFSTSKCVLLGGAVIIALASVGLPDPHGVAGASARQAGQESSSPAAMFADDFERDRGWTADPDRTDTATVDRWTRGAPAPVSVDGIVLRSGTTTSGRHALLAGAGGDVANRDVPNGAADASGGTTSIQSPEIVLPASNASPSADALTLSFNLQVAQLARAAKSSRRLFRVSVISAEGATSILSLSTDDRSVSGDWVRQHVPLDAFAGQTVRIRFEIDRAADGSAVRAAIDDLVVSGGEGLGDVRPQALGSNLALNRPATGSAACNANEGPAKAVNGSVSGGNTDKWCSLAATKFLQVDLGSSVTVSTFIIKHASAGGESATFNTRAFDVQVSTNGTTFTPVVNVTGNAAGTTTHVITARMARFVRLNVTMPQQASGGAARIYELEVYAGTPDVPPPSATWQEHWFEHNQLLTLARFNNDAAIYVDPDVDPAQTAWLLQFVTQTWQYSKQTYGAFGADPRMHSIHHQGRYFGGHPGTYLSDLHDFRNSSDIGVNSWAPSAGNRDLISHEIAHVVEGANNGIRESPAFTVWGDSKWAEFYQYDLYVALGMTADADRVFTLFSNASDNFPRAGTRWFRDWFFPLWRDRGRAQVMVRFFGLLAQHFPKQPDTGGQNLVYTRRMNLGEFIHFMSGAAGTNLSSQATTAFGTGWETQFQQARQAFPGITY